MISQELRNELTDACRKGWRAHLTETECGEVLAHIDAQAAEIERLREQPQQERLTLKAFEAMLVGSRVVDYEAIHDEEGYDDGVTRGRVYALYQRLIAAPQAQPAPEPERKPMDAEQIDAIEFDIDFSTACVIDLAIALRKFAKQVESFHNIKETP